MISPRLLVCLVLAGIACPVVAFGHTNPCRTGYVEWEDRSPAEIVAASSTIFWGRVTEFVEDASQAGFDGYYVISSNGVDLKGGVQSKIKIYGKSPYPYPPQSYFRVQEQHDSFDESATHWSRGGVTGVRVEGDHCPLLPRFVIGYDYLVMLGTESRMSFEPIHSVLNDNWYKLVKDIVKNQEAE